MSWFMVKSQLVFCAVVLLLIGPVQSFAGQLSVKKITLSRFEVNNGEIVLQKTDPDWPHIDRHNLTVDDSGRIYVLNLRNSEILVFNDEGIVSMKIPLPITKSTKVSSGNGYLEVSGNGESFLVETPSSKGFPSEPGYVKSRRFIINKDGRIVREFKDDDQIFALPDIRLCNKTYRALQGDYVYDEKFRLMGENLPLFSDLEGEYQYAKGRKLIKSAKDEKTLWEKQFDGNFKMLGVDGRNQLYLIGILKKGDSYSLYRLNSKGDILSHVPIPDSFPFLTQEEKDESEMHSSEEFPLFFKLACNGHVYLIYQLGELPSLTFKRWLERGEYFIHKFEQENK